MKKDRPKFNIGEKELMYLDPVRFGIFGWLGFSIYKNKKIIITNQRIIISYTWIAYESFKGSLSFYYNIKFFNKYKKLGDGYITKYKLDRSYFHGKYIHFFTKSILGIKIKIYTKENKKIEEKIKKFIL